MAVLIIVIGIIAVIIFQKIKNKSTLENFDFRLNTVDRTWLNYGEQVIEVGEELSLQPEYLLALIALECEGYRNVKSRFEPYIFKKLLKVREAKIENFEGIIPQDLYNSSDEALKNLASSWGPFQLMGYQCFHLDIKIKQLRGKKSIYYGAFWIKKMYGTYLEQKKFKDAFHLHNTGQKYPKYGPPKTHNKRYVPKGLKYMKQFEKLIAESKTDSSKKE
ncbi:MAG: hypothetical protein HUU47_00735 [Bacteroidetes bacterium]|nr:hypothetical protein [Bacteroidota bacterium]